MYILQFKNIENIYVFRYSFNYKVYQLFIYKYRGEKYVYVKFKENYYYIILSLCEIFKIFQKFRYYKIILFGMNILGGVMKLSRFLQMIYVDCIECEIFLYFLCFI